MRRLIPAVRLAVSGAEPLLVGYLSPIAVRGFSLSAPGLDLLKGLQPAAIGRTVVLKSGNLENVG